jgi:hypothetical protein
MSREPHGWSLGIYILTAELRVLPVALQVSIRPAEPSDYWAIAVGPLSVQLQPPAGIVCSSGNPQYWVLSPSLLSAYLII